MDSKRIRLLDCTLRDGGNGLQIAESNGIEYKGFERNDIVNALECLAQANVDIVEFGSLEYGCEKEMIRFDVHPTMEDILSVMPQKQSMHQMFSVMITYNEKRLPIEAVPAYQPGYPDIIRISVRYSELDNSLSYCEELCKKGYKVSINLAVVTRFTEEELKRAASRVNEMGAWAVYIVDSYGIMASEEVKHLAILFDQWLHPEIHLGFHFHNNMEQGLLNTARILELDLNRNIIVDSCCLGMGMSGGNLQTEIIAEYLNRNYGKGYDLYEIFSACDVIGRYRIQSLWGHLPAAIIPAFYRMHYKYGLILEREYKYSWADIYLILGHVLPEEADRCTKERLEAVLERFNDSKKLRRKP